MKRFISLLLVAVMLLGCCITVSAKEDYTIAVSEDSYVINANSSGNQSDNNFGLDKEIHIKTNGSSLTRYGYLKFDVSSLVGDNEITCIDLELTLTSRQKDAGNPEFGVIEVYGTSYDWSESSITFNDRPEALGLITVNDKVSAKSGEVSTYSITDYVKQAIARGEKEIALYLVENTPVANLHTRFASKDNGDAAKAPRLKVYHGTKTDSQVYGGTPTAEPEVPSVYVPSQNGIDSFIGEATKVYNLIAKEDTYVEGGNNAYTNYGKSEMIDFKAKSGESSNLYRIPLLKFDVSKVDKDAVTKAVLSLKCTVMQDVNLSVIVDVYSCDPYSWEEKTVTFSTKPDYEDFIKTIEVTKKDIVYIDVTDYVKNAINNGEKLISFYLDGDSSEPLRLNFQSKETENGYAPMLQVTEGNLNFATHLKLEEGKENPWSVAAERVSTWLHRWEEIKARGDMATDLVVKDESEYSLTVDATNAGKTDGYKTQYTPRATRTISTLKGYNASTAAGETAKYDVYGGLIDESMKQEATGFFYTKKVGDRWWTFDPLGYPFYRVACVLITPGSGAKATAAVKAAHGTNAAWADFATDRLQELGYNSTGGWSSIENLSKVNEPLAQTQIFYALNNYVKEVGLDLVSGGSTEMVGNVLPVFDPAFVTSTENTVKSKLSAYNTKDYVYGWMSDNELPDELTMLDSALNFDTADSVFNYSYATAWTFMYLKTGKKDVSIADVTDELRREFRAMTYDRYFEVVCNALEKYAPYHQYMGCRFLSGCYKDEYVMRVAGYWCDVISLNYYGAWEGDPTLMSNMEKWSGKPFIITEWYAKGMDVWEKDNRMTNQSGAGFTVRTQKDRGLFYQNYALMLMECKGCVGFDWFQYWDNDPDNLNADPSNRNANKGIYSSYYVEYTELTDYMKELNDQKYTLIDFFDER